MERVSTGLEGLDGMIGGGFPSNTTILVSGGPGSGKTLFALNFLLEGARKGEKCCYISLSENKEELLRACDRIAPLKDIRKHAGKNLAIEHIQLGESLTIKRFIEIIASYPKIERLVVDNVNKLLIFSESERSYRIHLSEMVKHLKNIGCSLILCESPEGRVDSGYNESFEVDGSLQISFQDFEEKPIRTLTIHKMRYTPIEPKIPHEFDIGDGGFRITGTKVI